MKSFTTQTIHITFIYFNRTNRYNLPSQCSRVFKRCVSNDRIRNLECQTMSHSWVRKLFRKAFETASPRNSAFRNKRTRLQFENLESRLTPSGSPPTVSAAI